jgi:thioredoxin-like negative regulator of GroEL
VNPQVWALAAVVIVVIAIAGLESFRSRRARRVALLATGAVSQQPYILYFTGEGCTVCKTHQEPALAKLGDDVRVQHVDAIAERELAERFNVYTLPTTIVIAPDGKPAHVNYGYAPAPKLQQQLSELGMTFGKPATA